MKESTRKAIVEDQGLWAARYGEPRENCPYDRHDLRTLWLNAYERAVHYGQAGSALLQQENEDDTASDMAFQMLARATYLLNDCHKVITMALGHTHGNASVITELQRVHAALEENLQLKETASWT